MKRASRLESTGWRIDVLFDKRCFISTPCLIVYNTYLTHLQSYGHLLNPANNRSSFLLLQTTGFQPFENKKLHSASSAPLFLLKKAGDTHAWPAQVHILIEDIYITLQ